MFVNNVEIFNIAITHRLMQQKQIEKQKRKKLLKVLMGCFVANILSSLVLVGCMVFKYMNGRIDNSALSMSVPADCCAIVSILLFLIMVKTKNIVVFSIEWLLVLVTLAIRLAVIVMWSGLSLPLTYDFVELGCTVVTLVAIVYASSIWWKIP